MAELLSHLLQVSPDPVSPDVTGKSFNMFYMFPIGGYFHEVYSTGQADFLIEHGAWRGHVYGVSLRNEGQIQLPGPFPAYIPALAGTITSMALDRYLPVLGKFSQWTLNNISVDAGQFQEQLSYYENAKTIEALLVLESTLLKGNDLIVGTTSDVGIDYDILLGFDGNDRIYGEGGNDILYGMRGNDILIGGSGADTLYGGDGSDIYYVDNIRDVVSETNAATGGIDAIYSYLSFYTLGDNVENGRILSTGTANLSGNNLDNVLYAAAGNNVLNGGSGTDTVSYAYSASAVTVGTVSTTGGSGRDTLVSIENLTGSNYNDRLTGNNGANVLNGGAGADIIAGGNGNDTLIGGPGKDTLSGGTGNDRFDFNTLAEMGLTGTTRDVITDFVHGQDRIDLSTLDADTATPLNNAFTGLIAGAAAFTAAGQLKFSDGVLYGNTDADSTAEFSIQLIGVSSLTLRDLIL